MTRLLLAVAIVAASHCTPAEDAASPSRKTFAASSGELVPSTCVTQPRAANDPVSVVFRSDPFISTFWTIDSLSRWSDSADPSYTGYFRDRLSSDRAAGDLLAAYADVRRRHSKSSGEPPDIAHPDDVMPNAGDASSHFARAFLCAAGPREAAAALSLSRSETVTVVTVFDHFSPMVDEALRHASYLSTAIRDLQALATESRLEEFLGRALRFVGSGAAVQNPLFIDVVWAPPKNQRATTYADQMVIPVTEKVAGDHAELAAWLGVIVHEFGHDFLGSLPVSERRSLSDRIVGTLGITRHRHANIIDEATQCALGNILFMHQRLPRYADDSEVYAYEPDDAYPDAIDSLARQLAPVLAAHIDDPHGFAGAYLKEALDAQAKVIPPLLSHHAHTALVLSGDARAHHEFDGLFWGRSRFELDAKDVAEFGALSAKGAGISRWIISTVAESHGMSSVMPTLDALAKQVPEHGACVQATRRPSGLGYDVAVIGADDDALRRMLITVSRGMPLPTQTVCQ